MHISPHHAHIGDASQRFLKRLVMAVTQKHMLDDPRDAVVCRRWVEIVDGIPDGKLFELIPATLRTLFRDPETRDYLEICGLSLRDPMRIQAIAPYVISFRRFMAARSQPADAGTHKVINELRAELRNLKKQFDKVFDQAAEIEAERERLQKENQELQQQVLSLRIERDEAQRRVSDGRSKAFRFLRLYLFMLKEELQRKSHDAIRLATVEIAIETNIATLEALGWRDQAMSSAREILGDHTYSTYFDDGLDAEFRRTPLTTVPDAEPNLSTETSIKTAPYLPIGEFRKVTDPLQDLARSSASGHVM